MRYIKYLDESYKVKQTNDRDTLNICHLLFHALFKQVLCLKSQDREDDCAGVDSGEGVARSDDVDVADAILVFGVIAAESDDRSERQTIRVEHLVCRV